MVSGPDTPGGRAKKPAAAAKRRPAAGALLDDADGADGGLGGLSVTGTMMSVRESGEDVKESFTRIDINDPPTPTRSLQQRREDGTAVSPSTSRTASMILLNAAVDIEPSWRRTPKRLQPRVRKKLPLPLPGDEEAEAGGKLLDGFELVAAAGVELPEDVQSLALMGKGYTDVEMEDLHHFVSLQVLDIGDNRVPGVHFFSELPVLRELKMPCNQLSSVYIESGTFENLETLDLAFNGLDAGALEALAGLPNLRELDLSQNCISKIPKAILEGSAEAPFAALETLHLGQQTPPLSSASALRFAALPGLRTLRLNGNAMWRFEPERLPDGGFPALGLLDLSNNAVEMEDDITAFLKCPALEKLVLWGNPLAQLAPREIGPEVPFLGSAGAFLVLRKPEPPGKPRLHTLYADPVVLDEELPAAPPFQVEEMVAKVEGAAKAGETARARDAEEEEGGSSFFITGGGAEVGVMDDDVQEEELDLLAEENERQDAMWRPQNRGPAAALQALKFALKHPLVEGDDGGPPKHHTKSTAAMDGKRREKSQKAMAATETAAAAAADPKAAQIASIENILGEMKDRLQRVEDNLRRTAQESTLP